MMPYRDPERQRAAKAEGARRRRLARVEPGRGTRTLAPLLSTELRIATARDVLRVIEGQVEAILADELLATAERARVISTLAGVALRAIEAGDLAGRLKALERHLQLRREPA
jgi:hypothetical protein